jgi:xanthine dehydrogenase accessory factor
MWLEHLQDWIGQGMPCALATVTAAEGSAPRKAGAKLVLNADGEREGSVGGGAIEHRVLEEARKVLADREPRTLRFFLGEADWQEEVSAAASSASAGRVTVFLEPVLPPKEIVAFGGGHIAERLARLCQVVGLAFRVYDERPEFASPARFANAVCAPYEDLASRIHLSNTSHCLVATHGHAQDEVVLEQLLRLPFLPYIGMVGSSKKIQGIRERLGAKGLVLGPHVYTPAGLALGGSLPEDIALSILAEVKLVMDGGRPEHLRRPS